ncbi:hypothetical protein ABW19_dt0208082 [Dactylella cylindrospora]|nr:hypothetical protein ABW19_dt0208082 [Dactylella cylindrospora]
MFAYNKIFTATAAHAAPTAAADAIANHPVYVSIPFNKIRTAQKHFTDRGVTLKSVGLWVDEVSRVQAISDIKAAAYRLGHTLDWRVEVSASPRVNDPRRLHEVLQEINYQQWLQTRLSSGNTSQPSTSVEASILMYSADEIFDATMTSMETDDPEVFFNGPGAMIRENARIRLMHGRDYAGESQPRDSSILVSSTNIGTNRDIFGIFAAYRPYVVTAPSTAPSVTSSGPSMYSFVRHTTPPTAANSPTGKGEEPGTEG